jgi:hypothetical protein
VGGWQWRGSLVHHIEALLNSATIMIRAVVASLVRSMQGPVNNYQHRILGHYSCANLSRCAQWHAAIWVERNLEPCHCSGEVLETRIGMTWVDSDCLNHCMAAQDLFRSLDDYCTKSQIVGDHPTPTIAPGGTSIRPLQA